jgi:hypothetical protein
VALPSRATQSGRLSSVKAVRTILAPTISVTTIFCERGPQILRRNKFHRNFIEGIRFSFACDLSDTD